jgi:bzd-type benzoyl-CoA reductase N subunit
LRKEGRKVLGYFCCYLPLELLTAAGVVPYRIMGSISEPTTAADVYLDPALCPFVKSSFDLAMKNRLDFIDGWMTPDSCDNLRVIYNIWKHNLPSYSFQLHVPKLFDESCKKFFRDELGLFKADVEKFAGMEITDKKLREAVDQHNRQRSLLRELYDLRKPEPPLIAGSEVLETLRAVMALPVTEANQLLIDIINEVKERKDKPEGGTRLLVHGPEIDDPALFRLIEELGANVVVDDSCIGTRYFWHDVGKTADPLDGIATRYLSKIYCPRTIRGKGLGWASYEEDLEERFGHIRDMARDFSVAGAILYIMRQCDLHQYDVPELRDYLAKQGLQVLHLESDYTMATIGALRTRIEAFLEMIP